MLGRGEYSMSPVMGQLGGRRCARLDPAILYTFFACKNGVCAVRKMELKSNYFSTTYRPSPRNEVKVDTSFFFLFLRH